MNDDELRSILHQEADRVEAGPDSWSRLESRLTAPPMRSAPQSFALGAVAIAVVAALVVGVVWIGREDRHNTTAASSPLPRSMPKRILAMTADRQLVVLDARTGRTLFQYDPEGWEQASRSYATGTAIAVAPDGRDFYFVSGEGNEGCRGHKVLRFGLAPRGRPALEVSAEASEPAISPDGRYLAYYRCLSGDERPDELVLRDLVSGAERATKAQATEWFGERLAFEADSRHVVYESISDDDPKADGVDHLYRLDLVGGEALPGKEFGVAPWGWFGAQGTTGNFLGTFGSRRNPATSELIYSVNTMRPLDLARPEVFSAGNLFWVPKRPRQVASDAGGEHVLVVAGQTLYRWSRGDKKPTEIRGGIIAAAWIPDRPPSPEAPIVAVDERGYLLVIDPDTGERRRIATRGPVDTSSIAPSPDGLGVYVTDMSDARCGRTRVLRVMLDGIGAVQVIDRRGLRPGVSRDGRYLVYLRPRADCLGGGAIIRRDLISGVVTVLEAPAGKTFVGLRWMPDSKHVLSRVVAAGPDSLDQKSFTDFVGEPVRRLRVVGKIDLSGAPVAVQDLGYFLAPDGTVVSGGKRGGEVLRFPSVEAWLKNGRVLFRGPWKVRWLRSVSGNGSGRDLLVVSRTSLYRWRTGDAEPRLLARRIATAEWVPATG